MECKGHSLAHGVQVRLESFGLLFYSKKGPRLYSFPSGHWLHPDYFDSGMSLDQWLKNRTGDFSSEAVFKTIGEGLDKLVGKGVLIAHTSCT